MVRTNLFHKPNSEINSSILKQLPLSVESRISKLSFDENVFIQAASVYQEALKRAGYNHKLNYNNSDKYNSYNNKNNDNNNSNNSNSNNNNNSNNNYKVMFNSNDNRGNSNNNNNNDNDNNQGQANGERKT